MAIKIGGTDVITNARQLSNIASVDATTVAALGAAGVGGGASFDATAATSFSAGAPVVLNSSGKLEAPSKTSADSSFATTSAFGNATPASATYHEAQDKVVQIYRDKDNSNNGTAIVIDISGTTATYGTPVVVTTSGEFGHRLVYDANAEKVVCWWAGASGIYAAVGTVSGTSISFGSTVTVYSAPSSSYPQTMAGCFDSNANKVVLGYRDKPNNYPYAIVGTVSGTSISFGTAGQLHSVSAVGSSGEDAAFDSVNNKILFLQNDLSTTVYATVGTVSGTSISFGNTTNFDTSAYAATCVFDTKKGHFVAFVTDAPSNGVVAYSATISGTGLGTKTRIGGIGATSGSYNFNAEYDPATGYTGLFYTDNSTSRPRGLIIDVESSSTNPIHSDEFSTSTVYAFGYYGCAARTGVAGGFTAGFKMGTSAGSMSQAIINAASSNFDGFIGLTDAAYTSGATATVDTISGINEALTGLSVGSVYYIQDNGTLSTTQSTKVAGYALASNRFLVGNVVENKQGWVLIGEKSGSTTAEFEDIPEYKAYAAVLCGFDNDNTSSEIMWKVGYGGATTTWLTSSYAESMVHTTSSTVAGYGGSNRPESYVTGTGYAGAATGTIVMSGFASGERPSGVANIAAGRANRNYHSSVFRTGNNPERLTAISIRHRTGNYVAGSIKLYGIN